MSDWHDSRCAAESRRGEVASILPETEQKTAIHTLYQSVSSCLIVISAHRGLTLSGTKTHVKGFWS
ncbi:hypothetical protein ELY35_24975 [Escherichia coli]|nr:hypothetical protein ELY35_31050 [Escherichia coli]TFL51790.1 hypothetical protein ELY35_24975 [Escherichia coli]